LTKLKKVVRQNKGYTNTILQAREKIKDASSNLQKDPNLLSVTTEIQLC
jgi:hypothetical protein